MRDLLTEILWKNEELPEAAARLCEALPGFDAAQQEYDAAARQIQDLVGYKLFDQFQTQLMQYTDYEVRAYYALGLGLRESFIQELGL